MRVVGVLAGIIGVLVLAGCGSADTDPANDAPDAGIPGISSWLSGHTSDLARDAARIRTEAESYRSLVRSRNGSYRRLLRHDCTAVAAGLDVARNALLRARQDYGEIDVVVAGIPRLAQYDTDLASGPASPDPRDSVSFTLRSPSGPVVRGRSLFYLLETSLYGTDRRLQPPGVKPDADCDGRSRFGEGLPDAGKFREIAYEFLRQARDLNTDAGEIVITESDAFTAMLRSLPRTGRYISEWKHSPFVSGPGAGPEYGASSRLSGLADLLSGIAFVYGQVRGTIAARDEDRAAAIRDALARLSTRVADLRDREASGRVFTAADADRIGAGIKARAEAVRNRLAKLARQLDIPIQSP